MLSAGEASGDVHGATLCRELARLAPGLPLVGMGGARMAAAGVRLVADPTRHAVVGTTEAVGGLPALWRAYRLLVRRIRQDRPRALVLIDFPDFNLRLARPAARAGVPVVYYIPPQVWAWRRRRLRAMRRLVSVVLAVFPFERALYRGGRRARRVRGTPAARRCARATSRAARHVTGSGSPARRPRDRTVSGEPAAGDRAPLARHGGRGGAASPRAPRRAHRARPRAHRRRRARGRDPRVGG